VTYPGDRIGYVANVYFLFYPAPSVQAPQTVSYNGFTYTSPFGFKRRAILRPTDCMVICDDEGYWNMSSYWPNAMMIGFNGRVAGCQPLDRIQMGRANY